MTTFIRKRDSARYTTDLVERVWPGFARLGPSYYLQPQWDGRCHYKTVASFKREYKNEDGSAIE